VKNVENDDKMLDKNAHHYQTLDMMPVIQERVLKAIDASKKAHEYLCSHIDHFPHDLWDDEQCLHDHENQIEQLILLKTQCVFWRKNSYLTPVQKIELLHLERSLTECEKISQNNIFILNKKLK